MSGPTQAAVALVLWILAATQVPGIPGPDAVAASLATSGGVELAAPTGSWGGGRASGDYSALFNEAGARHGVDPALLSAIGHCESGYNPSARSPAGAQGLMQFMPGTAADYGVDPWDPASAIDGAARYLADSTDRFGTDPALLAASYNAGPGAVARHGGVPPYRETRNYVACVTARL